MLATELFEFVSGYQCAIHQHHSRTDHFSQRIVGRANDTDLVYSGVRAEDVLHFPGDSLSPGDAEFFPSSDDPDEPLVVDNCQVTGEKEPLRPKRLLRLAGHAVIPIITLALFTASSPTAS